MEGEAGLLVLLRLGPREAARLRAASRGAAEASRTGLVEVLADGRGPCSSSSSSSPPSWDSLCSFLRAHPGVRRLRLRAARGLSAEALESLLEAAPGLAECDVTFAMPMHWPFYQALRERLRPPTASTEAVADAGGGSRRLRLIDTLDASPSPALRPREVVLAQAYGLHCRRADVCFRFASPANKAATGPLERFSGLFSEDSGYASMLGSASFKVGEAEFQGERVAVSSSFVPAKRDAAAAGSASEQHFVFLLSRQGPEHGDLEGCWMTDGVMPLDIESLWDGSLLDE